MSVREQLSLANRTLFEHPDGWVAEPVDYAQANGNALAGISASVTRHGIERAQSIQSEVDEQTADLAISASVVPSPRIGDVVTMSDGVWRVREVLPTIPGMVRVQVARRVDSIRFL